EEFESLPPAAQRQRKMRVIARHAELIRAHFREKYALIQLKKHLAWYTEGLGHATRCRAEIFQTRTADEVWDVFRRYWEIEEQRDGMDEPDIATLTPALSLSEGEGG